MLWASNILWYIARQSTILWHWRIRERKLKLFSLIFLMLCQKSEHWAAASRRKELLPENSDKSWYWYSWGVYGEKAFTSNTQRALQTRAAAVLLNQNLLMWQGAGNLHSVVMTGNLNLFDFISQVLTSRCQGVDRGKHMYFKASDLCLVNTTQRTHWVCNCQWAFSSLQI